MLFFEIVLKRTEKIPPTIQRLAWTAAAVMLVAFSVLAPTSATQAATEPGVLRATLSNGLRVIIVRNTLAPVVATSVNYLVGSDETPAGFPGMAHAQEHMMFRGSPGLSADQRADIGSLMGGRFNANTRESLTQYLFTVPAANLDVALHVEALRMQGISDTEQEWDKERGAIEQEVAQDHSNPFYALYEKLREVFFAGTVYAHDALGTRPSFDKTTAAMLKRFHDTWYAPNNAILVVVGDLDPPSTLKKVKELFGQIPSKRLPPKPAFTEKPVRATTVTFPTDDPNTTQILSFRTPGLDSPDFPALEILADILNSHRFALYDLVPQGKAIATAFSLQPLPKASVAYAAVSIPAGGDAAQMAQTIRSILLRTAKSGVTADLVAAAKLPEERDTEFQKNSIEGLASAWADAVALYGLPSPEADLARIKKVTLADVNRVARKYLDVDHALSATMEPKNSGKPVTSGGFGGQEAISLLPEKSTTLPAWADVLLHRLSVPPTTLSPVVSKLSNGLTLIVQPESVSHTVSIYGHIRNRPETEEPLGKEGVSIMLDQLMTYGTTHLDRLAFQSALDDIGADEDAGTDFHVRTLSAHVDRAIELLADNELSPALPAEALESVRARIEPYIASRNTTPAFLTQNAFRQSLFPADDPSLRYATGSSVAAITLQDVQAYYRKVFRPDLTTIVVIGDVTPDHARALVEKYFGDWTGEGPLPVTDLPQAPPNKPTIVSVPDTSRVQDIAVLGQTLAMTRSDPDYYALALGNALLSGGFYSSRLSIDLRKNAGLVYSVNSDISAGRTRSVYVVQYASDPQNVGKAANIVAQDLSTLQHQEPSAEEINRAKALLLQQITLSEGSVDDIAQGILNRQELGLPIDEPAIAAAAYIDLTPAAVEAAFAKWIRPSDLVRVVQGPAPTP
jgi:zinc protease